MAKIQSIRWEQLYHQLGDVAYQLTKVQCSSLIPAKTWRPAINAYRCRDSIHVYVDLSGVEKSRINLQVEPRRLCIGGQRQVPEPIGRENQPQQILAMEIDAGPFEREITFAWDVDTSQVTARQENGVLCIHLPLQSTP